MCPTSDWAAAHSLVDLLQMPEADGIDVDFEPIRIGAADVDA
jgi:hypothetical protein